jgi:hypothetical protein
MIVKSSPPTAAVWVLAATLLTGCDLANRFSRETRCGLVRVGEPTQSYEAPSSKSQKRYLIQANETCLVVEAEIQKTFVWLRVACEGQSFAWIENKPANRTYYPER